MIQAVLQQVRELAPLRPLLRAPSVPYSVGLYDGRLTLVETGRLLEGGAYLRAWADAPLAGHRIPPSLSDPNLEAPGAVAAALDRLVKAAGMDLRCCNLLLPDRIARVNLLSMADVPPRGSERENVLRWKLRKTTPFPIEEAILDWETYPAMQEGAEEDALVVAVRERVLRQYEGVLDALGVRVASVTLASFAIHELCAPIAGAEDWALLHVSTEGFILLAIRRHRPLFYRCKTYHRPPGDPARALHRELVPSMEYYRERLSGTSIARVLLWGPLALDEEISQAAARATGAPANPVDLASFLHVPEDLGLDRPSRLSLAPCLGPAVRRMG